MEIKTSSAPLLGLLTWGPMSGYEIKKAIGQSLGSFWSESYGQLYPHLKSLHGSGLIQPVEEGDRKSRAKKTYAITRSGRAALAAWLNAPPGPRPPRNELLLKVFFANEADVQSVKDYCRIQLAETKAALDTYKTIEKRLGSMDAPSEKIAQWRLTLRYGQLQAEAAVQWCSEAIDVLNPNA